MEKVNCNLCNSNIQIKLFTVNSLNVVKCKNCNLVYVNPRLTQLELNAIYHKGYFENPNFYEDGLGHYGYDRYFADKSNIQENFRTRLNNISKFVKPGKLLDIGCAAGFFLDIARENGWETEGIELSKEAIDFAKKKLKLNVKSADIQNVKLKKNFYDVIAMFDIIEHLSNPKQVLKKINCALKIGGMITITTPDVGSLVAKIMGRKWPEFKRVREHIYFFSEETLGKMLNETGFEILKKETTGRKFTLISSLEYVSAYSKFFKPITRVLGLTGLSNLKVYLNPGYKMTLYAKKISNLY